MKTILFKVQLLIADDAIPTEVVRQVLQDGVNANPERVHRYVAGDLRILTPPPRIATAPPEPPKRPKKWARDFDACQRCGTTQRKHKSRGYCAPCWEAADRALEIPGTWRWRDDQEREQEWRAMREYDAFEFEQEYERWHLSIGHMPRISAGS